jgi:hypothetical protein
MNERDKVTAGHRRRDALVYVRQSTMAQVECHRESTDRQYALVEQARRLGWAREQIAVIDDDLGLSGANTSHRKGFARMTAEVALGRVGSCSASRSPAWPATTPTGIACSISVA